MIIIEVGHNFWDIIIMFNGPSVIFPLEKMFIESHSWKYVNYPWSSYGVLTLLKLYVRLYNWLKSVKTKQNKNHMNYVLR